MLKPCCGSSGARSAGPAGALGDGWAPDSEGGPAGGAHVRLPAKIDKAVLDHILTRTNLGPKEIKDLYKRFRKIAPDGSLPFSRFCETLGVLGMVDDTFLAERLFNAFDTNGDSRLSFTEFAVALGVMMRGSDDEKLDLSFKILNPTYGGVVTCLTDYGLTSFEVAEDAASEEGGAGATAHRESIRNTLTSASQAGHSPLPPSTRGGTPPRTARENSCSQSGPFSCPSAPASGGGGGGGGMTLQRYEQLKDQIELDSIGFDDFVQLIKCVDATRKALVGGSGGVSPDVEKIRKVFLQNSTLMPDGTSRMMLLDFKHAVRTSPAFLALLGVLPQELAVDTSAGHQCFPTGRRTFTFPSSRNPPAQGAAVHTGADFNRETVAAILSELKVVREELEQVMDYVVRSALATPSSLDGANQSSCPEGHGVSKDRTAHEPHGPSGEGSHGKAEGREDGCGRRGSNARPPAGLVAAAGGRGLTKHFLGAGGGNDDREKDLGGDKVRKGPGVGCSELNGRPLGGGVPGGSGGGENNKGDDGGGGLALEVVLDSADWSVSSRGSSSRASSLARAVEESQLQRGNDGGCPRPLPSCQRRNPLSPPDPSYCAPSDSTTGGVSNTHASGSRQPSMPSRGTSSMGSPSPPLAADMNLRAGVSRIVSIAPDASVGTTFAALSRIGYGGGGGGTGARTTRGSPSPATASAAPQGLRARNPDDAKGVGGVGGLAGRQGMTATSVNKDPAASDAVTRIRDMENRINYLLAILKDERSRALTSRTSMSSPSTTTNRLPSSFGSSSGPHTAADRSSVTGSSPPLTLDAVAKVTSESSVVTDTASGNQQKKGETGASTVMHGGMIGGGAEGGTGGRASAPTVRACAAGMGTDTSGSGYSSAGKSLMREGLNKDAGLPPEAEERSARGPLLADVVERGGSGHGRGPENGDESSACHQMADVSLSHAFNEPGGPCGVLSEQPLLEDREGGGEGGRAAVDGGKSARSGPDRETAESSVPPLPFQEDGKDNKQGRRLSSRSSSCRRQGDHATPRSGVFASGGNGARLRGKGRSLVSKKVTIRVRESVMSAGSQVEQADGSDGSSLGGDDALRCADTMETETPEGGSLCRAARASLSSPSMRAGEGLHVHRMYMNRPNFHRLHPKEGRRRRRAILPMRSLVLRRDGSSGLRPAPASKGLAVHFGHENWNTVINIMVGIRLAAGRASSEPQRAVGRYDFVMKEKFSILPNTGMVDRARGGRRSLCAVRFVDYAPMVFRRLREKFQISSDMYVRSVGPEQLLGNLFLGNLSSLSELVSEGKSGALFYYTADGKFMIKTISKDTAVFLRSVLLDYYQHVMSNPDTLLTRFFGLHAIRLKEKGGSGVPLTTPPVERRLQKTYFIVMVNFFHTPVEIHRRYDLKGSSYKRQLPPDQLKDNTVALKDLDMDREGEKIELGPERREMILAQMQRDVDFLKKHDILDYSLLLGIFYRDRDPEDLLPDCPPIIPSTPTSRSGESSHAGTGRSYSFGSQSASEPPHTPFFQVDHGGMRSVDKSKLYYVGIIDVLTRWGPKKKLEHVFKTVQTGDPKGISCVNPVFYAERFMDFMRRHIC